MKLCEAIEYSSRMRRAYEAEHSRAERLKKENGELIRLVVQERSVPLQEQELIEATASCNRDSEVIINPFEYLNIPGDFNYDGAVDGKDLLAWQIAYADGGLDGRDFLTWQRRYGRTEPISINSFGSTTDDAELRWENPWKDTFVMVIPHIGFVGEIVVEFTLSTITGDRAVMVRVTITVE